MASPPTRIDEDVYASAAASAATGSRSAAQQISHWARIGRALEESPGVSLHDIRLVLDGREPYDSLDGREQAIVRAEWDRRIDERLETVTLDDIIGSNSGPVSTLDEDGNVVYR